jgi:endonuclease/exonuclease/phosphatase family metal-dependent hydrolase
MKIYSWNVLYINKHILEMSDFIERLDFDVLCLQEVPIALLEIVKKSFENIAYGTEVQDEHGMETYSVIISKHAILKSESYEVPLPSVPFRARITMKLMSVIDTWNKMIKKGSVFADILMEGKLVRVYCVHLTIAGPTFRAKEFQTTLNRRGENIPEIIAGDFNIVEHPLIKIYSWLLGSPLKEGMPWFPERRRFDKKLDEEGLQNPLKGRITHPFSVSQLDHILLSRGIIATKAWVELDSYGSDHQPVGIECEFEQSLELN